MKLRSEALELFDSFKEIARKYCEWARAGKSNEDPHIALGLLAELYFKVKVLEGIEVTVGAEPAPSVGDEISISTRFADLIPFDPKDIEVDPVILQDDLTDIYMDLIRGLTLYQNGKIDEAIWEWRFSFHSHWGNHAVSAMKMLHGFLY